MSASPGLAQDSPGAVVFQSQVVPFFRNHCVRCHGKDTQKADVTLHDVGARIATDADAERFEAVLEMLESGEMPPEEEEAQPTAEDRERVARWLQEELRRFARSASENIRAPVTRRLTNFEYHNTMRDLLGIELDLTGNLPEDPTKPYRFHNTAQYLRMGLEQLDRYEENARRAMASVIVSPEQPKTYRTRKAWSNDARRTPPQLGGLQPDEIGVTGNRNRTVANGMQIFDRPATGSFRVRLQAAAILPPGTDEVPLHLVMGYDVVGIGVDGARQAKPLGTLRLTNDVDHPQVFEFTGRVENFPWKPERRYRRGGKRTGRLVIVPPHFTITPINIYDDGTLNEAPDPLSYPRAVVQWMEFEAHVAPSWPPGHHARILFPSPLRQQDPDAYLRLVLERFMRRAFRRPVHDDEVERYLQIHQIVASKLGLRTLEESLRETLAMVLIAPDFLFHMRSSGDEELRPFEIASRLSYFLWGSMPDAELVALAESGELLRPTVVAQQARRLLRDRRTRDFVANFASQWLALEKLPNAPINSQRFPRFLHTIKRGQMAGREVPNRPTIRDAMREETIAFLATLIERNASLLQIVDSDFAMLNQRLAAHYGVDGVHGHALRPVPVRPEHHLGGLLTHGSILVGTGTGTAPHPIYRAVWLREAILGDEVRDPPADVPALEESAGDAVEAAHSLQDLLREHRKRASCKDCHARLDPWGIPFERYDATGRFHDRVPPGDTRIDAFARSRHGDSAGYASYLDRLRTVPVDATAKLPNGPQVDGLAQLKQFLLRDRKADIARNVVRRLLSYSLGRELNVRDRDEVNRLLEATQANGYRLQDLIVAICQTEAFLGRRP